MKLRPDQRVLTIESGDHLARFLTHKSQTVRQLAQEAAEDFGLMDPRKRKEWNNSFTLSSEGFPIAPDVSAERLGEAHCYVLHALPRLKPGPEETP